MVCKMGWFLVIKRALLGLLFILLIVISTISKSAYVNAQDGNGGDRFKLETKTFTQYTWKLVTHTGITICTVRINHEGFPSGNETLASCNEAINSFNPTPTATTTPVTTPFPTATPLDINKFFLETYWVFVSQEDITQTIKINVPDMIINIYAPGLPVNAPYVIIKAIEPFSEFEIIRIAGTVNGNPFECRSDQCIVPLLQDSRIVFWAESSFGDQTKAITATARSWISNNYYNVRISTIDQYNKFNDSCREMWENRAVGESPQWVTFPQSPDLLATDHDLYYLAGKLILHKFVNAENCPDGGLFANGSPNACGLQVAYDEMVAWQNRFDPTIWGSGKEYGVPPIFIKSLIEQETQFWPENAKYIYEEYGFTQINELGADVALRWNDDLKNQICSSLLFDCDPSFANMNSFEQAMLRGGLIRSIDAYCPSCENMIDLNIAEQSISIITQTIQANCRQTNYVIDNLKLVSSTTDMWKFTILSYHAGYQCLESSLKTVKEKGLEPNWNNVSANLACPNARSYVDSLWDKLASFEFNYAPQPTLNPLQLTPTGQSNLVEVPPTITPIPSITPKTYLTDGVFHIFLYVDYNNNFIMDQTELTNQTTLLVEFANGITESVPITNGEAIIHYTDQFKNATVKFTVQEIHQVTHLKIPESGELFYIIRIPPPQIPGKLP